MTDREKVIAIGYNVMGWKLRNGQWMVLEDGELAIAAYEDWNPQESIADAFEVQSALTEEGRHKQAQQLAVIWLQKYEGPQSLACWIANATARQRMDAVIEALELDR